MFRFSGMLSSIDYTPDGLRLLFRGAADIEHFERPGRLLHWLDHLDFHRGRSGAELAEPARADQHPGLQRAHCAVERFHCAREIPAKVDPVSAQVSDALVELGAELADLLGVH